jgi:phosphoribosyl 1,2-cyclic phosphate phosphodiesterase
MKVTILGSGTSQGVPVIACDCEVCMSTNSKDKRLRSSIMLTIEGKNYVIDSGPDFRQQMLREKVQTLEAILFTHEHKDHIAGLDDVRAFNFKQKKALNVYCSNDVAVALKREFHYVFSAYQYPGIPKIDINLIDNKDFYVSNNVKFTPIQVYHYKMPVFGFRVGDFTYITDAKTISDKEIDKIKGSKVVIVNALHEKEHISHFNLKEAIDFIKKVNPEKAYLTHISHLFGKVEYIESILPKNVFLATDGLCFDV